MSAPLMTAEELLRTPVPGKRTELVRGTLVVREPAGYHHGRVTMRVYDQLAAHCRATGAGEVTASEVGFRLASDPDTVRAPDVAFIRHDRLPAPETRGFPAFAPDLVVEVISPDDRPGATLAKVGDWLDGGARLVWVIHPERRVARVYRADGSETPIPEDGALSGEDVLPEFACPLGAIL